MGVEETVRSAAPAFVAKNHFGKLRPIAQLALDSGTPIDIWGGGWEDTPVEGWVRGGRLENRDVPRHYRAASAVLCDQTGPMQRHGFVSNRIYDALACAAPVICTPVSAMPSEFLPYLYIVENERQFAQAVEAARLEGPEMKMRRVQKAVSMIETDSFDTRAKTILEAATSRGLV